MMNPGKNGPGYLNLRATGELEERAIRAHDLLRSCTVCPRKCRFNRQEDERGFCRTGLLPVIASYGPHFGEEPPLVGRGVSPPPNIARRSYSTECRAAPGIFWLISFNGPCWAEPLETTVWQQQPF